MHNADSVIVEAKLAILVEHLERFHCHCKEQSCAKAAQQFLVILACASDLLNECLGSLTALQKMTRDAATGHSGNSPDDDFSHSI